MTRPHTGKGGSNAGSEKSVNCESESREVA